MRTSGTRSLKTGATATRLHAAGEISDVPAGTAIRQRRLRFKTMNVDALLIMRHAILRSFELAVRNTYKTRSANAVGAITHDSSSLFGKVSYKNTPRAITVLA